MEGHNVFADFNDTPLFRMRLAGLVDGHGKLGERLRPLLAGLRRYRDALVMLCQAQAGLTSSLADFFMSPEGDAAGAGVPVPKVLNSLREITSYFDLLKIQVEYAADELQNEWIDGLLVAQRDTMRQYERAQADMEDSVQRYLGLRKACKREVLERAASELAAAKVAAEEARYAVSRRCIEVEMRRKYYFLQLLLDTATAHTTALSRGSELMGRLVPVLEAGRSSVTALQAEEKNTMRAAEEDVARCKAAADIAAAHVAAGAMVAGTGSVHGGSSALAGGPGTVAAAPPGLPGWEDTSSHGPVQMTAGQAALVAEVEAAIRAARMRPPGAPPPPPLRQGYLLKRSGGASGGGKLADWKRRFFVLDACGMLFYYSHKHDSLLDRLRGGSTVPEPVASLQLLTSTVKLDDETDPGLRFVFRLVSPIGTLALQAESEADRQAWVAILQAATNSLLNSNSTGSGSAASMLASIPGTPVRTPAGSVSHHAGGGGGAAMAAGGPSGAGAGIGSDAVLLGSGGLSGLNLGAGNYDAAGSRSGGRTSTSGSGVGPQQAHPLEVLRRVGGNRHCVDCGAPDPDWASLNLGVLMCIECSGVHRRLGVHISKVRSCTLDVKVWDAATLELFGALGNEVANRVWEAKLISGAISESSSLGGTGGTSGTLPSGPSGPPDDQWVWCEEEDEDDPFAAPMKRGLLTSSQLHQQSPGVSQRRSKPGVLASSSSWRGHVPHSKPGPAAALAIKAAFIEAKYLGRAYVSDPPAPSSGVSSSLLAAGLGGAPSGATEALWEAVERDDTSAVLQSLAQGADLAAPCRSQRAAELQKQITAAAAAGGGGASGPMAAFVASSGAMVSVLHLAAALASTAVLELILQNGAVLDLPDPSHLTPLHWALLADNTLAAKLLLRRGASTTAKDKQGLAAFDLVVVAKGRVTDEQLLLLLMGDGMGDDALA